MRPFYVLRLAPLLLITATGNMGCSAGGGGAGGGDASTLVRTASCEKTACAASRDRCEQQRSDCTDTCASGRIDDAGLCFDICRGIECDACDVPDATPCVQEGYRFTVTGAPNPSLESACTRYEQSVATCADDSPEVDCKTLARTGRPALASAFDCAANLACGDTSTCFDILPTSDLGQVVCDMIEDRCPAERCAENSPAVLDNIGSWLRDDAAIDALECAAEACFSVWPCLEAWSSAIR